MKTDVTGIIFSAILAALIHAPAFADTWECTDSTDGHKYRATQSVAADVCTKIDDVDHSLDGLSEVARQAVLDSRKPRPLTAEILDLKIGISRSDAMRAFFWGPPGHINKTTTARGISEQWVYEGGKYLYFENGILTAIQN
jgi:hypothetical protein